MLSSLVFPLHDPQGSHYALLTQALPMLKDHFTQAFVTITAPTRKHQPAMIAALQADPFFHVVLSPDRVAHR